MQYIPLKRRIYDLRHARDYLPEIESWDPRTAAEFPRIRLVLKAYDEKKNPFQGYEPADVRALQRGIKQELALLRQYCRAMDDEERANLLQQQVPGKNITVKSLLHTVDAKLDRILELLEGKGKPCQTSKKSSQKSKPVKKSLS